MNTKEEINASNQTEVPYNDRYIRIGGSLLAAQIFVMLGENISLVEALLMPSYYVALLCNFMMCLVVFTLIKRVTKWLDTRHDWNEALYRRLLLQFLFGVVLALLLSFFLAVMYFTAFDQQILNSTYPYYELPLTLVFLLLVNIYYFASYYYHRFRLSRGHISQMQSLMEGEKPGFYQEVQTSQHRSTLIVQTSLENIPVQAENICYVFILGGCTFIRTFNQPTAQEAYPTSLTLSEIERMLDKKMFFRINRQVLLNIEACRSFRPGDYKTLEVALDPSLPLDENKIILAEYSRLPIVSEDRVPAFRKWVAR